MTFPRRSAGARASMLRPVKLLSFEKTPHQISHYKLRRDHIKCMRAPDFGGTGLVRMGRCSAH